MEVGLTVQLWVIINYKILMAFYSTMCISLFTKNKNNKTILIQIYVKTHNK